MGGPKTVNITLKVSAQDLYNANPQPTTQAELIPYCGLKDDNKGKIPPGKTLNDYTTEVSGGYNVTWDGKSTDVASYKVLITGITNNPAFFSSEPKGNSGKMTAKVKDGIGDVLDTYTIDFSIDPPNQDAKYYSLDPKLKAKSNT